MYHSSISGGVETVSAGTIQAALTAMAGKLEVRFSEAGDALARAYEIVERLVSALESVTNAVDRKAADTAIEKMRGTADRLMRLPALQEERARALRSIRRVGSALDGEVVQVFRILSFLTICGLNIKVAAAGAHGFSDFADTMSAKLDIGEREMRDISRKVEMLAKAIPEALEAETRLARECATVIPHVPRKLAQDAIALREHQSDAAARAEKIAEAAREIRTQVAQALGALQIGDITRQRLEHIATAIETLETRLAERTDLESPAVAVVRGHVMALLAAQADDALEHLTRESRLLASSLGAIGPTAAPLLELKESDGADQQGSSTLEMLEQSVAGVASVTGRLQDADKQSNRLSNANSDTAKALVQRLKNVQRVRDEVQQIAWNADLRCSRMGQQGRALAVVASEIRGFAGQLETRTASIGALFDELARAAESLRDPHAGSEDAAQTLTESLACIRDGSQRMRAALPGLDREALAMTEILRDTTDKLDCEDIGNALCEAAQELTAMAALSSEPPENAIALLQDILRTIASSYTMAREREVHHGFAFPDHSAQEDEVMTDLPAADDDDDDGLF